MPPRFDALNVDDTSGGERPVHTLFAARTAFASATCDRESRTLGPKSA
jgi:hypothetical protein